MTPAIYTTCPACGLLLDTAGGTQAAHHLCTPPIDPAGQLAGLYRRHLLAGRDTDADRLAPAIDAPGPTPDMKKAALYYAEVYGWPVFPLVHGTKKPFPKTRGFIDASRDTAQIREWWKKHPDADIGVPTSMHFDVVDIDAVPGGWYSYLHMDENAAIPDIHGWVTTPRGGAHLYITPRQGRRNKAPILRGVDIRAGGGYVVVPPSLHPTGHRYTWRYRPSPIITRTRP